MTAALMRSLSRYTVYSSGGLVMGWGEKLSNGFRWGSGVMGLGGVVG